MNIRFHKSNTIFLLVFLLSLAFMIDYVLSLKNLDYIWNYGFSAKISLGLIPYRDFSVLQTPLSFYITALFLKLFGNYILVYVMLGAFAITLMYYLFYAVSLKINNNQPFSFGILLVCIIYTLGNLTIYNYNSLSIIIILFIILREFEDRKNTKNNLIIGLLLGALFLTKQNASAIVIAMMTFNILSSRITFGEKWRIIFIRAWGCLFPILLYFAYLYLNNALYDFIDHAFLGIIDFSDGNKFSDSNIIFVYLIIPALFVVKSIALLVKEKRYSLDDKLFITLTYSIAGFSMLYPALDLLHLTIGVIISFLLISFIYRPENIVSKRLLIICYSMIVMIFFGVTGSLVTSEDKLFNHPNKYYQYIPLDRALVSELAEIETYIAAQKELGNQVVIVDNTGMLYQLEAGVYDDKFDMLVKGNVGYKGVERLTEKFKAMDDGTIFLVGKTQKLFEMTELKTFVICNYEFIEAIPEFYVYKKIDVVQYQDNCRNEHLASYL